MRKHWRRVPGNHVYLSPLLSEDAEPIAGWRNDPALTPYWDSGTNSCSLEKTRDDVEEMMKHGYHYAIVSAEQERLLGVGSITGVSHLNQSGFLWLAPGDLEFWTNGCGQEAVGLLLEYGFHILNLYAVTVWAMHDQQAKLDCLQASGFREIGRRRELIRSGNRRVDTVYMDMLADDFARPVRAYTIRLDQS
ncbi:GNAT family N-acetyltransferase [Paenibacillus sp. GCM10012303]|jgi:RimJ/RimL family protein N-acetyltransferase|uniref:GNAT family N-acetyltransferase n=1 Tax=Paenibacillus sp. GCM10012303 TaxID=3317340 RepID=UPI0036167B5A